MRRLRQHSWRLVAVALCQVLVLQSAIGQPAGIQGGLKIVIIEGADNRNVVQQITPRPLIVRVQDAGGGPVAGAFVVFTAPGSGPGGDFTNDSPTLRVVTGDDGLAVTGGYHPNGIPGRYQIQVRADFEGQTASAVIPQTNVEQARGHKRLIAILAIAGGAAGAAVASRYGKSTSTSTTPTITFGGAAVGAPHP